jgi:hypothetical protein
MQICTKVENTSKQRNKETNLPSIKTIYIATVFVKPLALDEQRTNSGHPIVVAPSPSSSHCDPEWVRHQATQHASAKSAQSSQE